jgi:hypothetical protein
MRKHHLITGLAALAAVVVTAAPAGARVLEGGSGHSQSMAGMDMAGMDMPGMDMTAAAAPAVAELASARSAHHHGATLRDVKKATKQFKRLRVAQKHGYAILKDAQGIACIDNPGVGAMGIHYVKGRLVGDDKVKATRPEALVYEPRHGKLRLVAVEYVVFQDAWDATHSSPPKLFGHEFMLQTAPNRFGLPAFYMLHAWIYKHNPAGTFEPWNPRVHCPAA